MNTWNPQKVLNTWLDKNYSSLKNQKPYLFKQPIYFYKEGEQIPIEELQKVVIRTAQLVDALGHEYIGLFERAEKELKKAQENMHTLERIRNINHQYERLYLESNSIKPSFLLRERWTKAVSGAAVFMSH